MFNKIARRIAPVLLLALVAGTLLSAVPAKAATQMYNQDPSIKAGQAAYVAADWRDRERERERWRREHDRDAYLRAERARRERERWERERWEREHGRRWNDRDDRYYHRY